MSERFWRNFSTLLGRLSIGLLFVLVIFCSCNAITDLDLWMHWRMGWWICHHGFVPDHDILSFPNFGKPWINHEWLFQVLVYQVQHHFGFNGLILMQALVVVSSFTVLLLLGYKRERQWVSVFGLFLVLMVFQPRFTIRPEIFSFLFLASFIYILSRHLNKPWAIYALVFMQILWSNMHFFFFFGPMLVCIFNKEYSTFKRTLPLLILACLANPMTFKGALDPVNVFFHLGDHHLFFANNLEFQKPLLPHTFFNGDYLWYKAMIVISALSFVLNYRRIDVRVLILWAIFLGFSMMAVRNLAFFAVAAYMVIMINTMAISSKNPVVDSIVKIALLTWMIYVGMGIKAHENFLGISKSLYPQKAVDFLVQNKIKGNFFNDFNSGAYLTGRAYPNIKVFIFGHMEDGDKFLMDYQKIYNYGDATVFKEFEGKYNITGAFLNNANQNISHPALLMFHSFPNWSIVYLDHDAVIFLKQTPDNKIFIDRFSVDLNHWKTNQSKSDDYLRRAYILEILGADEGAINELKEAVRQAPDFGPGYNMLGKIYNKIGQYPQALENYRLGYKLTGDIKAEYWLSQYHIVKDRLSILTAYLLQRGPISVK